MSLRKSHLPGHGKENDGHTDIGKDHTHPYLFAQRIQKAENPRFLFDGLFDHYTDSKRHEGFTEVDHSFTFRRDCHGGNRNIRLLQINTNNQ